MPLHVGDRIAGLGLIAGLFQEFQELGARHVVFGEREGADRDVMLRAFAVEAAGFTRRTSHDEAAGRNGHHLRAVGTFLKLAFGMVCGDGLRAGQKREQAREKPKRGTDQAHDFLILRPSPSERVWPPRRPR